MLVLIFKPLASACFVAIGMLASGADTPFGIFVVAALLLSFWGDVFLMLQGKSAFLAGLVSFLLGHVAFCVAFAVRGIAWSGVLWPAVIVVITSSLVAGWLLKHVDQKMKVPVLAYIAVISVMVVLSFGTFFHLGHLFIPLGAVLFFASDLSVALERFVKARFLNKLWGLPLYYAAQLLFVWTLV
jgi:uncharacterized membrane protein YhhN